MNSETHTTYAAQPSRAKLWTGRILSALPSLMLIFAASLKIAKSAGVIEGVTKSGFAENLIRPIGILELTCTIVYLIPRTRILGAILLTGFLGGATVTEIRIGDPNFFMPVLLGIMFWAGVYLRDERLRELIPFTK